MNGEIESVEGSLVGKGDVVLRRKSMKVMDIVGEIMIELVGGEDGV